MALGVWWYEPITRFLVINLGLRAANVRPWSLLITVLIVQILVYRLLEAITSKLPRHFFSKATHLVLGLIPALICGVLFASYVFLVLIALPFKFPFKADLVDSRVAGYILGQLPAAIVR